VNSASSPEVPGRLAERWLAEHWLAERWLAECWLADHERSERVSRVSRTVT